MAFFKFNSSNYIQHYINKNSAKVGHKSKLIRGTSYVPFQQ